MASSSQALCMVCATVPTGLEQGAAEECKEVLGRVAQVHRGRISFELHCLEELIKLNGFRSIDNCHIVVKKLPDFCTEESTVLQRLESLPFDDSLDWQAGLSVWRYYRKFVARQQTRTSEPIQGGSLHSEPATATEPEPDLEPKSQKLDPECDTSLPSGPDSGDLKGSLESQSVGTELVPKPKMEDPESSSSVVDPEHKPTGTKSTATDCTNPTNQEPLFFRVTCTRGGRKHCFSSPEAASHFGAGLVRCFGWKVRLKNPDLEVLLNIADNSASVGIALTHESMYKRNIAHFGPTTLRSTIAYGLLRLARIQPGEIVVDPMCGGGSISIEGALAYGATFHLAGDIHELAIPRALANFQALYAEREKTGSPELKAGVLRWDVCALPLRTASVDVIVTDMPFGKKSGSRVGNWELYPQALQEVGRVCRPSTARAVLLTHDIKVMSKILQKTLLWKRHKTLWINMGGLTAGAYILNRTKTAFIQ